MEGLSIFLTYPLLLRIFFSDINFIILHKQRLYEATKIKNYHVPIFFEKGRAKSLRHFKKLLDRQHADACLSFFIDTILFE